MQPHFNAPAAGGNYPLSTDHPIPGGSHQMCFGGITAHMGDAGTHSTATGSTACPAQYFDASAEDGVDCSDVAVATPGSCGADEHSSGDVDHGSHEHPATTPAPSGDTVTPVQWLAGFQGESAQAIEAHAGDILQFVWDSGDHDVQIMADKDAFDNCDFSGATSVGDASHVQYTLTALPAYFACSVDTHCASGQKLAVTEHAH